MTLVMLLLTLAVVGGVAALFTGRITGGMPEPGSTVPVRALPDRPPTGADVVGLRFSPALRGYRMDQVDAALDRLGGEIDRLRAIAGDEADRADPAGPTDRPPPEPQPWAGAQVPAASTENRFTPPEDPA